MVESSRAGIRSRENTRARLLAAAAEVFAEVGMDAASVEAVCERAGFTRGAFYSNFESKDELFLELAASVARERVAVVTARVSQLEREGAFSTTPDDAGEILQQVLDVSPEDRLGVLLMSEIRLHAMRDPQLAAAYLAQDEELCRSVAQIIDDIVAAKTISFRLPSDEAARLMLTIWESASVRAAMEGVDYAEMCRRTNIELARVAQLLIASV